jgi:hypothetical protein
MGGDMMRRHFFMKVMAWVIVFSLCIPYGFTQEIGKITYIEGRVDIFKAGSDTGIPAREYENISVGDSIRTKSNSKAEITFSDNSVVRLAQSSKVEIKDYELGEKNERKRAALKLERGKIRTIVAKMKEPAEFAILTPNSEGKITGSDIFTFYQAGSSGILVAEGKMSVASSAHLEKPIMVTAGLSALVPLEDLPQGPRPFLDIEKKLYEQDTDIAVSMAKPKDLTVITANIAKFSGEVKVTNKGETKTHAAKLGEVVKEGDLIETGKNGLVEIRLDNNNAVNLKPDSKLLIVKLLVNSQTGEYENIFELTIGKIKARIEGLKGKSKFEVKTPLAICGARGTILYVNSLPGVTDSFIEGGNGYLTSTISGNTREIPGGQGSSANSQGGVSNPIPFGGDQRQEFTEGWNPDNGVEGYSSPEGSTGAYLYGSDTDTNTTEGEDTDAADDDTDATDTDGDDSVDIPFTESNPPSENPPPPEEVSLSGDFLGNFAYYDSWSGPSHEYLHLTDHITDGTFIGRGGLWTGSQSVTLSGNFARESIDYSQEDLWVIDSNDLPSTTVDGARLLGTGGGTKVNNIAKGVYYGLYIRPVNGKYQAGYASSTDLTGSIDTDLSGGFSVSGTLNYEDMGETTLSPEDLFRGSAYIKKGTEQGNIGADFLSGSLKIETFDLRENPNGEPYDWGIWRVAGGGSYTFAPTSSWNAPIGGSSLDEETQLINAYWLGDFSGDKWGSQDFSANVNGIVLSDDRLEEFTGKGNGIHYFLSDDNTYRWEFLGGGMSRKTFDLTSHASSPKSEFGYYDQKAQKETFPSGSLDYLFGTTGSLWQDTAARVTIIGKYSNPDNYKLWDNENPFTGYAVDGARFYTGEHGYLGGIVGSSLKDSSKGIFYAFYIRENPSYNPEDPQSSRYLAGYLRSDNLSGNFHSSLGMFKLEGSLKHYLDLPTTFSPDELAGKVTKVDSEGHGLVSGSGFSGTTASESYYLEGQNWGLWAGSSGGTYDVNNLPAGGNMRAGGYSENAQGEKNAYWFGETSGSAWQNNAFLGTITGTTITTDSLQTFIGDTVGTYGAGNWEALSAGAWTSVPLQFVSPISDRKIPFSGLLGSTQSPWSGDPVDFTFIGTTSLADDGKYHSWGTDFTSHNYHTNDATTYDGGAYRGGIGGLVKDNNVEADAVAIYIDKDGNAGTLVTLEGTIGTLDTEIDTFKLNGKLQARQKASHIMDPALINPGEYLQNANYLHPNGHLNELNLQGSGFESLGGGTISGSVSKQDSTVFNIIGQPWGTWLTTVAGTFSGLSAEPTSWRLALGGQSFFTDTENVASCWLGTLDVSQSPDGKLTNTYKGLLFSEADDPNFIKVQTISGGGHGYVEVAEGSGTWQAGVGGEWVEVSQLLDPTKVGFTLTDLQQFVSVPVTEVYNNSLTATSNSFINSATVDISLYQNTMNNLWWTAGINGTHSSTTDQSNWSLAFNQGSDIVNLTNGQWANNQWTADVSGNVGGNSITGQAAGTYDATTFTGVGTGTCASE